jgi:hypothetical protein
MAFPLQARHLRSGDLIDLRGYRLPDEEAERHSWAGLFTVDSYNYRKKELKFKVELLAVPGEPEFDLNDLDKVVRTIRWTMHMEPVKYLQVERHSSR